MLDQCFLPIRGFRQHQMYGDPHSEALVARRSQSTDLGSADQPDPGIQQLDIDHAIYNSRLQADPFFAYRGTDGSVAQTLHVTQQQAKSFPPNHHQQPTYEMNFALDNNQHNLTENWTTPRFGTQISSMDGSPSTGPQLSPCPQLLFATSPTSFETGIWSPSTSQTALCPPSNADLAVKYESIERLAIEPSVCNTDVCEWLKNVPMNDCPDSNLGVDDQFAGGFADNTWTGQEDGLPTLRSPSAMSVTPDLIFPMLDPQTAIFNAPEDVFLGTPTKQAQPRRHSDCGAILKPRFPCGVCRQTLADKKGVTRHMLAKHSKFRPLRCICGRVFMRTDHLKRHERTCPFCQVE